MVLVIPVMNNKYVKLTKDQMPLIYSIKQIKFPHSYLSRQNLPGFSLQSRIEKLGLPTSYAYK